MNEETDWDTSKENFQPRRGGATAETISNLLQPKSSTDLSERRKQLEKEIADYQGDDPLAQWVTLINWVEASYPKGGKESGLDRLIKSCCKQFAEAGLQSRQYFDDERFVHIWLKLATHSRPLEIFEYMARHSVRGSNMTVYGWLIDLMCRVHIILLIGLTDWLIDLLIGLILYMMVSNFSSLTYRLVLIPRPSTSLGRKNWRVRTTSRRRNEFWTLDWRNARRPTRSIWPSWMRRRRTSSTATPDPSWSQEFSGETLNWRKKKNVAC